MRWEMMMVVVPGQIPVQRLADVLVRLRVDGGQGIVEDHHGRFLRQHPRDGHALLLSAQSVTPRSPTMVS